jgi:hypothetical protein
MAEPPPVKKVTRVYLVAHGFAIHVPFSHWETKTTALQGHALQEAAQFEAGDNATLRIREDRTGEP